MKGRERAIEILMEMTESTSAETMLDYLIVNYLSGSQAYEAMKSMKEEFYGEEDEDEEDEVDGSSWRESEDFFNEDEDEKELREINRIEIADLIGRDFHHKDAEQLVYTIAECLEGTSVKIVWSGTQDVYYSASEVIMYIEDGTWILI